MNTTNIKQWHSPKNLTFTKHFVQKKQNKQHGESIQTNLNDIIFLFWEQVLFLLIPADACFDDAAEHILVAGDAWQTGLDLRQYHIVCR